MFTLEVLTELVGSLPSAGMIISLKDGPLGFPRGLGTSGQSGGRALGVESPCNSHQRTRPICADRLPIPATTWLSVGSWCHHSVPGRCRSRGRVTAGMELGGGSQ